VGESLWVDLDAWQVARLENALVGFGTLNIQTVRANAVRDPQDWNNPDYWSFPAILVYNDAERRQVGDHGDGSPHYKKTYPYFWIAIVTGDRDTAQRDAKLLAKRLETAARAITNAVSDLPADDSGENLRDVTLGNTLYATWRRQNSQDVADAWWGVASLEITFKTRV
jgi:hypothetical protein